MWDRADRHHPNDIEDILSAKPERARTWPTACQQGGTSIHSNGSSPGFATELMPFAFATMQRRLDCITKEEFADMSKRDSPDMIFNLMGFGKDPATMPNSCPSLPQDRCLSHHLTTTGPRAPSVKGEPSNRMDSESFRGRNGASYHVLCQR